MENSLTVLVEHYKTIYFSNVATIKFNSKCKDIEITLSTTESIVLVDHGNETYEIAHSKLELLSPIDEEELNSHNYVTVAAPNNGPEGYVAPLLKLTAIGSGPIAEIKRGPSPNAEELIEYINIDKIKNDMKFRRLESQ